MSETIIPYNVLWVEDEDIFVKPLKIMSKKYGLKLNRYTNWQEAKEVLVKDFDSYSAIIFDAHCKLKPDSPDPEKIFFLPEALIELLDIFGKKQKYIPWYVFSGQIKNEEMTSSFQTAVIFRKRFNIEWGEMLYDKTADEGSDKHYEVLFKKIHDVAKTQSNNIVLYRHAEVFKYLGSDSLIDGNARQSLLRMLGPLYFPASEPSIKFEGNPLRKVVEYIFRSAHKVGLLPIECFEQNNQVNLLESSRYMSGLNTKYSNLRYGNAGPGKEGRGGDSIFPEHLGNILRAIIEFGSVDSHTNEVNPYTIDDKDLILSEDEKELFYGYVFQLCHLIKFFGHFVNTHSNVEANKAMKKVLQIANEVPQYEGVEGVIYKDGKGNFFFEECVLSYKSAKDHVGSRMILKNVRLNNNDKTKAQYPFYAQIKVLKSDQ